jgi:hypothetical protein
MRKLLAAVVLVLTGNVVSCQRAAGQDSQTEGTMLLRNAVLLREPFKAMPPVAPGTILAVMYDWEIGRGVVTLVAFHDGTTSVYLSSGGGFIGTGSQQSVQRAAAAFREEAARVRGHFTPATAFPLPERGKSRFHLVTDSATLQSGMFTEAELQADAHPLGKLAHLAQDVITAVRQASK